MEIAWIYAAIMLNHKITAALAPHAAAVWSTAEHPVDDAVEEPYGDPPHVILHPFVKHRA